ncbi:MAG TPA: alpha-glucosidase [Anaerolineaceae bacterium]|nr:alpha-glucosidase [Anaerolineaceae bacterium]
MNDLDWWKKAVFYQIYPRSFADSNGDGIGDLPGIIQKIPYLKDLGVDAIWLSPIYPSPLRDCGYDVADYLGVAPEYGTMDDFRRLLEELHRWDMRLILDLVLNHTSDQHPWFLESRSSLDNPKRDWYLWRDGKNGGPPNNWYSTFGGPAWELDPITGQYYYHFFFKEQPDLNWRNKEVRQTMFALMRAWMEMGVDGFRLDAIGTIFEDPALPDQHSPLTQAELYRMAKTADSEAERLEAVRAFKIMFEHQVDRVEIHSLMRDLRAVVNEYPGRVLVGETDLIEYYGNGDDELHMVFNFPLMRTEKLSAEWVRANQALRLSRLPAKAWPCNTLGNHDSPRVYSHFGDGIHDQTIARTSLALMLTLKGTPFLYNGEEIGMTDLLLNSIDQFRDQLGIWAYETEIRDLRSSPEAALVYAARQTRDRCRTPLQWANAPNGGFCPKDVKPWLPVNPNYAEGVNVEEEMDDPVSLLHFYRELLQVRRANPALVCGDYLPLSANLPGVLVFLRQILPDGQACLVVINLVGRGHQIKLDLPVNCLNTIFSSRIREKEADPIRPLLIAPYEVYIAGLARIIR